MKKRTYLLIFAVMLLIAACSGKEQETSKEDETAAQKPTQEIVVPTDADRVREERKSPFPLEEFTFNKSYSPEEPLEEEITVCGFEFDILRDKLKAGSLEQQRSDLRCFTTVLVPGTNMWNISEEAALRDYMDCCVSDDSESPHNNVQQAFLTSSDDMARFTAIRYTLTEEGSEGYTYTGTLFYTDGISSSSTVLNYIIDENSGNGEDTEAALVSLLDYYDIDYEEIEWKDLVKSADTSVLEFEETQELVREDMEAACGPVRTFAGSPVYDYGDYLTSIHPSGVKLTYALREEEGITSKKFLKNEMKNVRELAEGIEGASFEGSDVVKREDGTFWCRFRYTDKDGKPFDWIYAAKKLKGTGMRLTTIITKSSVFGSSENMDEMFEKTAAELGFVK